MRKGKIDDNQLYLIHKKTLGTTDTCVRKRVCVSDGSYFSQYGTAAWVLQGTKSRCSGQVVCPGSASDQNSYRSEVSGLLAILLFVDLLAKFFSITTGSIEVACDGESALSKIFSYIPVTNILDPCSDLISTAQHLWRHSPLH